MAAGKRRHPGRDRKAKARVIVPFAEPPEEAEEVPPPVIPEAVEPPPLIVPTDRPLRVLWFGDMAATGFGTVTMDIGRELVSLGIDVRFLSQNDLPAGQLPEPFLSRTLSVPTIGDMERHMAGMSLMTTMPDIAEAVPKSLRGDGDGLFLASGIAWGDWKPDAAVLLGDFAAVRFFVRPYIKDFASLPTFHYMPVEGVDLPPAWGVLWQMIQPIAMSRFGGVEITKVTGRPTPVIYHGVDAEVFRPATPDRPFVVTDPTSGIMHSVKTKEGAKAFFQQDPSCKWVLRTDRHMPRKLYNSLFRAMAPVLEEREDVRLVIHCGIADQGGNLMDSLSKYPEPIRERVILTGLGPVPREVLAILYNAADVYASPSAEGFGLTIAEAIACGVPAVGIDYSAVPEVIGPAGTVIPPANLIDNEYDHFWARPDEAAFGQAVAWFLDHPQRARGIGSLGPSHVRDHFSWKAAAEGFASTIREGLSSWRPLA